MRILKAHYIQCTYEHIYSVHKYPDIALTPCDDTHVYLNIST